jgi:hypothetical protein
MLHLTIILSGPPGFSLISKRKRWLFQVVSRFRTQKTDESYSNWTSVFLGSKGVRLSSMKKVSVVIPTFNRPDALTVAIWSVLLQSHTAYEIIVVGDCASQDTQVAIDKFSDQRIRYINLPLRCGDQSIPNAVGTQLAEGEYVAYLNHDDVWSPQHLEVGLAEMEVSESSWFIGKSMFAYDSVEDAVGRKPIFSEFSRDNRSWIEGFGKTYAYFEPNSSWIIAKEAVLAVGNWFPANKTRRTPVASLGLRVARKFGEPTWGKIPTVAKVMGEMNRRGGAVYGSESLEHRFLNHAIHKGKNSWFEGFELEQGVEFDRSRPVWDDFEDLTLIKKWIPITFPSKWAASLFRSTGIDLVEGVLGILGIKKGQILKNALVSRTGEKQQTNLTVEIVLKALEKIRANEEVGKRLT